MSLTMDFIETLKESLFGQILESNYAFEELTLIVEKTCLLMVLKHLKDVYKFEQLIDVVGVDYLTYGESEWQTDTATSTGFSRGVIQEDPLNKDCHITSGTRFYVVYHLLSLSLNIRLRVKVGVLESNLMLPTAIDIWPSADWHEREVFDMFGIMFVGHPDLRRILTDYGFVGHPFRKDFSQNGYVEMRYDEAQKRIVYEPVEIDSRVTTPKVIREDSRYLDE